MKTKKVYVVINYSEQYVVQVFSHSKDAYKFCFDQYMAPLLINDLGDFNDVLIGAGFDKENMRSNSLEEWNEVLGETPCNIRIEKQKITY